MPTSRGGVAYSKCQQQGKVYTDMNQITRGPGGLVKCYTWSSNLNPYLAADGKAISKQWQSCSLEHSFYTS